MSEPQDARSTRFYFSFRSPYAWLATERLEAELGDLGVAIERIPIFPTPEFFPNDPTAVPEKIVYLVQDVRRLAREQGLAVRFPSVADTDWAMPHAAFLGARGEGDEAAQRFGVEVFRKRFAEGLDLGDDEVLADAARQPASSPTRSSPRAAHRSCAKRRRPAGDSPASATGSSGSRASSTPAGSTGGGIACTSCGAPSSASRARGPGPPPDAASRGGRRCILHADAASDLLQDDGHRGAGAETGAADRRRGRGARRGRPVVWSAPVVGARDEPRAAARGRALDAGWRALQLHMRILAADLEPKLLTVLREGYSRHDLARDALAGVVVGVVALPLAIAFAIASGARPEQGIYTAIVAGFLISLLGGSRVQIGGPTGAFIVLVSGVIAEFGPQGLLVATLMAGVFLVLMAVARLGDVIRFVPYPVTVGFTSGIALIIAAGQVGDALGLRIAELPSHVLDRFAAYAAHIDTFDPAAAGTFVATIAIIQLWTRVPSRIPGPLLALLATTAAVHLLGLPIETIHSRFGDVPRSFPTFAVPEIDLSRVPELVSPAIAIALLAAIESLLSAVVADGLVGGRHRSNAELLAQGIANIASPLFGGLPATGAIARTATNVRNGGRSPIAGIVHAAALLLVLMVAGSWAGAIAMATLAGILVVVAYNMSEWHVFVRLLRSPRSDVAVLLATFALTVAVDLVVAIQVGVVLAALLFMRRMAEVSQVRQLREITEYESFEGDLIFDGNVPHGVEVFELNGSFCFGAARKFTETLLASRAAPRVVILRMRHVLAMDATGLHALEDVAIRLQHSGTRLLLSGVHAQPLVVLERSGALERIGEANVFSAFSNALEQACRIVDDPAAAHGGASAA